MPRGRSHYHTLGVARDASSIEIANAVREKLADLKASGASEEQSQAVRDAYQVLANPDSRAEYDSRLPPDPAARAAAEKKPGAVDFVKDVVREAGLVKAVVPVAVVLMIGIIWIRTRAPAHPPVNVVTPPIVVHVPKPESPPKAASEDAASAAAPENTATAPPAPAAPKVLGDEGVFAAVSNSVARIQVYDASGRLFAQGSGVATGNTLVITNCHVVSGASRISVKVAGVVLDGVVQVADRQLDLCSLRVAGLMAPPVQIATGEVHVGQAVFAIGAPQGLELTLSEGIVSSLRQTTKGTIIQTTAPISPGSSGGGLFNAGGQLVGIVTFQHKTGQNLNFALPASWIFEMQDREATEDVSEPVARSASNPQ